MASGPYTESDYQFMPGYNWGNSDFDSRNMFKIFGMWSPVIFHSNSLAEKVAGGWTLSPIFNFHSGFPYNPTFQDGIGCNAFYQNSGNCNLRPTSYTGGAGSSQSTDTFKNKAGQSGSNFSKSGGGTAYFATPTVVSNPNAWSGQTPPTPTGSLALPV